MPWELSGLGGLSAGFQSALIQARQVRWLLAGASRLRRLVERFGSVPRIMLGRGLLASESWPGNCPLGRYESFSRIETRRASPQSRLRAHLWAYVWHCSLRFGFALTLKWQLILCQDSIAEYSNHSSSSDTASSNSSFLFASSSAIEADQSTKSMASGCSARSPRSPREKVHKDRNRATCAPV